MKLRASALLCLGVALSCAAPEAAAPAPAPPPVVLAAVQPAQPVIAPAAATTPRAEPALAASQPLTTSVAFVGDIAMIVHIAAYLEGVESPKDPLPAGYPFHDVAEQLRSYDLAIGNLECVVTNKHTKRTPKTLTASLKSPQALLDAGFDAVSVANNHTLDMSWPGYFDMLERLDAAKLPRAGVHSEEKKEAELVLESKGIKIAVVGHFKRDKKLALEDVARAKTKADVVIVFVHWGNEYEVDVAPDQRAWGHTLIDAGADAVVGAHPHVVQPEEIYNGKLIAYSLGNFVFPLMWKAGTSNGALLELDVAKTGVVDHRYRRVKLDPSGAPALVGEPTKTPPLSPPKGSSQSQLAAVP